MVDEIDFVGVQPLNLNIHENVDENAIDTNRDGDIAQVQFDTAGAVQIASDANNGNHFVAEPSKIFSSTFCSGPSPSGNFESIDLSDISVSLNFSTGTRNIIEQQLRDAGLNLEIYEKENLMPVTANRISPPVKHPTIQPLLSTAGEQSANQSVPLSPGFMVPIMSNPENMIESADREAIKIFHTI